MPRDPVSAELQSDLYSPQALWNEHRRRWVYAREKFAAMGFPVTHEIAENLKVPFLDVKTIGKAHALIGNGQMLPSNALVKLACFV